MCSAPTLIATGNKTSGSALLAGFLRYSTGATFCPSLGTSPMQHAASRSNDAQPQLRGAFDGRGSRQTPGRGVRPGQTPIRRHRPPRPAALRPRPARTDRRHEEHPGLLGVREDESGFVIGAATPGAELGEHAALRAAWPGVVEAANLIGSTQVQGRASLAGNLCNASPAADSVPALIAAVPPAVIAGPERHARGSGRDDPDRPGT